VNHLSELIYNIKKIEELLDQIVNDRILNTLLYRTFDNQMPQEYAKPLYFSL
jgi:hypothetical protein